MKQDIKLAFQNTMKAFEERNLTRQRRETEKFVTKYQKWAANEKNYVQQELKMILDILKGPDGQQILKQRAFKGTGLWPTIHSLVSHTSRTTALKLIEDISKAIKISPTGIGMDLRHFMKEK